MIPNMKKKTYKSRSISISSGSSIGVEVGEGVMLEDNRPPPPTSILGFLLITPGIV